MPLSTLDLDRNMFSYLVQMASMTLMRGWRLAKERNECTYNSRPKGTLRSVHNIAMRLSDYAPAAPHHPIAALEDVTALFQDLYNGSQRAHFKPSLLGRHNYCMAMERFYKEEGSQCYSNQLILTLMNVIKELSSFNFRSKAISGQKKSVLIQLNSWSDLEEAIEGSMITTRDESEEFEYLQWPSGSLLKSLGENRVEKIR